MRQKRKSNALSSLPAAMLVPLSTIAVVATAEPAVRTVRGIAYADRPNCVLDIRGKLT